MKKTMEVLCVLALVTAGSSFILLTACSGDEDPNPPAAAEDTPSLEQQIAQLEQNPASDIEDDEEPANANVPLIEKIKMECAGRSGRDRRVCEHQVLKNENPEIKDSTEVSCLGYPDKVFILTNYQNTPGRGILCDVINKQNNQMLAYALNTRGWCDANWNQTVRCPPPPTETQQPAPPPAAPPTAPAEDDVEDPSPDESSEEVPEVTVVESPAVQYSISNGLSESIQVYITLSGQAERTDIPAGACALISANQWEGSGVSTARSQVLECRTTNNEVMETCTPGHYRVERIRRFFRPVDILRQQGEAASNCTAL